MHFCLYYTLSGKKCKPYSRQYERNWVLQAKMLEKNVAKNYNDNDNFIFR